MVKLIRDLQKIFDAILYNIPMKNTLLVLILVQSFLFGDIVFKGKNQPILYISDKDKPGCIEALLKKDIKIQGCLFYIVGPSDWKITKRYEKYSVICESSQDFCGVISNEFIQSE